MNRLTIRRANIADLEGLAELFDQYRVFYKQESDKPRAKLFLAELIKNDDSVIFVSEVNGTLTGFVQLFPSFTSVGTAKVWILNDLYVNIDFRKQGIAESLIKECISFSKVTDRKKILLETGKDNSKAQNLYDKIGFMRDSNFIYSYNITA